MNLPSWKRFWSPLAVPNTLNSEASARVLARSLGALVLTGLGAIVLQVSVFLRFSIGPDLLLILSVYIGIYYPSVGGAAAVFFLGYLFDSSSGTPGGGHACALSVVFAAVVLVSHRLWLNNPVSVLSLVLLAVGLKTLTLFSLSRLGSFVLEAPRLMFSAVVWDAALTMLLTPLVFTLLYRPQGADR